MRSPKLAGNDGVELIERQIDAMVGDAVLREVIGPDPLAAVAGADQVAAGIGAGLVLALLLSLEDPAAQDAHRLFVVFRLAAAVLALHFQLVGRALLVPDAHGGLGLVDVLAAGAAGPHPFPFDVRILDLDGNLVRLRQNGDGGRRGVNAPLRFRLRRTPLARDGRPIRSACAGIPRRP